MGLFSQLTQPFFPHAADLVDPLPQDRLLCVDGFLEFQFLRGGLFCLLYLSLPSFLVIFLGRRCLAALLVLVVGRLFLPV